MTQLQPRLRWAQPALVVCLVLLLRLPFLNQAIQGDDFYYLKGAEHAQIDPLHPTHARYMFLGQLVDMRGHPHPPLNAWYLGLLIRFLGEVREVPFHAAYVPFSIIAALSAWAIAARFGKRPLLATVLFLVTPAFVVNGNSLESDLPFLAFWLLAIAAFVHERWRLAVAAAVLAAFAAYQAVVLAPVMAWWLFIERRPWRSAWIPIAAAPLAIVTWQLYERLTSGSLPATVLAGYMQSYNLQALAQKLKNAGALTGHMGWLLFPALSLFAFRHSPRWAWAAALAAALVAYSADPNPMFWLSVGTGSIVLCWCAANARRDFLAGWVSIFFAAALVIFFAGSVRYLLPLVVPVAILASDRIRPAWLVAGASAQAVLALGLAVVNYQHWGGYRDFVKALDPEITRHRTWTNAEWGLRHYLEQAGAMPLQRGRELWPGDLLITSAYFAQPQTGPAALIAERTISSPIPLRVVALGSDSAYSSISFGLAPFGMIPGPMDVVRAELVSARMAEFSLIEIGTPQAEAQIVSGIYNNDRWTAKRATVVLKRPPRATQVEVEFFIPPAAPARVIGLYVDGSKMSEQTCPGPGKYTISATSSGRETTTVTLEVDKTFSVAPDQRELGVLVLRIGYR